MHTLAVCWSLVTASIRAEMQYRFNFLIEMGFGLLYNSIGYVFVLVILGQFDAIGGWSLSDVTLIYGIRLCGHGLWALVFSNTLGLDWLVQDGDWDRMLVRPVPAFFQLLVAHFRVAVFGDFLAGILVLAIGISVAGIDWTAGKVLFLVASVVSSAAIDAAFQIGPGALAFRFVSTESIRGAFEHLFGQFAGYPLSILERKARFGFTFVIPLAFVAWVPGAVLLDRIAELPMPAWAAWCSPVIGPCLFAIAVWFFLRESRQYQSTGS